MLLSMLPWSGRPPVGSRWYLAGHETSREEDQDEDEDEDQTMLTRQRESQHCPRPISTTAILAPSYAWSYVAFCNRVCSLFSVLTLSAWCVANLFYPSDSIRPECKLSRFNTFPSLFFFFPLGRPSSSRSYHQQPAHQTDHRTTTSEIDTRLAHRVLR